MDHWNRFVKRLASAGLPALLALGVGGCASSSYLAKVNDEVVTGQQVKEDFVKAHGGHAKFLLGVSETRQFLNIVIDQRLLVQEAYRLDLENQPDIKKAVADFTERKAAEYLVKTEIDDKAQPSPDEVKAVWQNDLTTLYRTRQIVTDTKEEAESVYQMLAAGADFEMLARQCSIGASRIYGGRLPYLGWGALEPAWEKVVFGLQQPEVSPVFATADGWEIVQLEDVQPVDRPTYEQATRRIDGILKRRRTAKLKSELSDLLWTKYHVKRADIDLGPESLHKALKERGDEPLVTWDGEGRITVKEFVQQVDWQQMGGLLPGRFRNELEERLRQAVNDPLARREAMARGLDKAPEVASAVRIYREDLMERALYADFILKDVKVTDAEISAYYAEHKADFMSPEKRRVAQIVAPTQGEAQAIRAKIEEGESFEMLARTASTDTASAKKAGDLGWITKKEASGEFEKVFSLEEGQVSEPLSSKFGWHLIKVEKIMPPKPQSQDEAREAIKARLTDQKQREARNAWLTKLRAAATIQISDAGIKKFVKSEEQ